MQIQCPEAESKDEDYIIGITIPTRLSYALETINNNNTII